VSSTLPPEAAGLLALAALLLLPGLLVVRAPWTAVPALSLAFWALSWWWLPFAARSRVLAATLVVFVVLALLRLLPRHTVPPPPGHPGPPPEPPITGPTTADVPRLRTVPSLVIVGLALALLVPLPFEHHAPGPEMAFHTTSARLVLWRDGPPATYQPLLPVGPFGAHSPALPTLAGDLARIAGLDPARAVLLMTLASHGLVVLGLYALLSAVRLRPSAAALGALVGLAATPSGVLAMWGAGGPGLALGFGLSAAALLLGHTSRPSAVAAGMLLGAAALAQPLLALAVGAGLATAVLAGVTRQVPWDPVTAGGDARSLARAARLRLGLACAVALGLAGPGLLPLARALSVNEALGVLGSPRPHEIVDLLSGLVLVPLVALLARGLAQGSRLPRVVAVSLVAVAAVVVFVRTHGLLASGQLAPESRRALSRLARTPRPLEAVCAPESLVDWVPALAGRPAGGMGGSAPRPWVPHALREERARSPVPPCSRKLDGTARRP